MSAKKFRSDLNQGNIGEKIIATWLEKYKGMKFIKFNNDNLYDILMEKPDGSTLTIECKTDRWEFFNYKTGNIFIETRCNGKSSGIWSSIADIYAFYFPDFGELYFISTKELKVLLKEKQNLFNRKTLSGDGGKVSGFTINRYDNKDLFKFYEINKLKIWEKNEF